MKFTEQQLVFIAENFDSLTSRQLFDVLSFEHGLSCQYTSYRTELYNNGFYKVRMRRWTEKETKFLYDNYKTMGNIEIAEKLSKKNRVFNKKQIEKKMKLEKITRTREEINAIIRKHKEAGRYSEANFKRWEEAKYPEGFLKTQKINGKPVVKIKVDGVFIPYARYRYQQLHGPIPEGYRIKFKDCNPLNISDENLSIFKGGLTTEERKLYKKNLEKSFERRTKVLTPEMEKYIVRNAKVESINSMSAHLGISDSVITGVFNHHKIIVPKELVQQFKIKGMSGRTTFTPKEDKYIKENYLTMPVKRIAKNLNRSHTGINTRLRQLGLEIPAELRVERRIKGMFRKGQVPPNKGQKMSAEIREKSKHTWFQKGHLPINTVPDWEERIREEKGRKYILIKIPGERKLKYKHIWIWEEHHGKKLESGFNIVFRNGNTMDISIENLECISDSELMSRNTLHRFPEELRSIIYIKGAIKRQINKIEKQQ